MPQLKRVLNKKTGVKRYFLDGKRVSYEKYSLYDCQIWRTSCISVKETKTHKYFYMSKN